MSYNQITDNENVVHICYGIIFSFKERNEIMNFASKWVELGKIILNEVTQTENVKCCMLFFTGGSYLQIFRCEYIAYSKYRNKESKRGQLSGYGVRKK